MSRRISKANSITTYDTATLWRALEASSVNQQNQTSQKEGTRRWQRAASRLLRQNTVTSISSHNNESLSSSHSAIAGGTGSLAGSIGGGGSGLINSVLNHLFFFFLCYYS
jgi:putative ribosome biogenesis GTPase RsgA